VIEGAAGERGYFRSPRFVWHQLTCVSDGRIVSDKNDLVARVSIGDQLLF
jgi:hypothetical protein